MRSNSNNSTATPARTLTGWRSVLSGTAGAGAGGWLSSTETDPGSKWKKKIQYIHSLQE